MKIARLNMNCYKKKNLPLPHFVLHNMKLTQLIQFILLVLFLAHVSQAGPLAHAVCQSGCNCLAVACYTSAGFVFGTVTAGIGTPAVILGCNAALGTCMVGCIPCLISPTL